MTSLLSPNARTNGRPESRKEAELRQALVTRRPLVPTATLGGALAAGGPLLVCMAVAVVGWFLTDAGGHGTPSGALRVGAFGWLLAHGAGVSIEGVRITAVPLGLTLLCVWSAWRVGHRVGESVSGHGPDADRIGDGERDWTVPLAGALFAVGYVLVGVVTAATAATVETAPSTPRVVLWATVIAVGVGVPAVARGSGRAAIWWSGVPVALRDTSALVVAMLRAWAVVVGAVLLVALVVDFSTAANIVSQLEVGPGDTALIAVLTLTVLPNAGLLTGAYLLGPGFTVGAGTLVSPGMVVLGPLPLFPLLAALPDAGPTPGWAAWLIVSPLVVAFLASALAHRARPATAWDQAAIRGCSGGLVAGAIVGLGIGLAGGAVGPGRMTEVGALWAEAFLHAVTAFGIGGLLGALATTWWQRRGAEFGRWARSRLRQVARRLP